MGGRTASGRLSSRKSQPSLGSQERVHTLLIRVALALLEQGRRSACRSRSLVYFRPDFPGSETCSSTSAHERLVPGTHGQVAQ